MEPVAYYVDAFNAHIREQIKSKSPAQLYDPIVYIMQLGGKRLRPALTLMTTALLNGDYKKAFGAAMAIEVFHNFSLVHDDIMDEAPLRRGKETVHKKWDLNTGILSGDAMLIWAYRFLEDYTDKDFRNMVQLFSKTAIEVCEGQQFDIDFEKREDVTIEEYLMMIEYKTAVLLAAALKMGAMVAQAKESEQELLYNFGKYLGIAFQLQDDYLDVFGNPETFGKQSGGDIIENKKTFLYLKTKALCNEEELQELDHLFSIKPADPSAKVRIVKELFNKSGAADESKRAIKDFTEKAFDYLEKLEMPEDKKAVLRGFGEQLIVRKY